MLGGGGAGNNNAAGGAKKFPGGFGSNDLVKIREEAEWDTGS